jgi:hypothetical protein
MALYPPRISPRAAIRTVSFLSVILGSAMSVPAAQLKEAQVTQVVKDVKLLPTGAAARPATVNDEVRDGIAVRTGVDSRSEFNSKLDWIRQKRLADRDFRWNRSY